MYYTQYPERNGEAYISLSRNRIKSYLNTVYLKDKQEFEIELFNPSNSTKAAEISINGKPISKAMIVLKPGQRVYLERYIDTVKKFLFETYEVENSEEAKKAIENNGNIEVRFYDEYISPRPKRYLDDEWIYQSSFTSSVSPQYGGGMKVNSLRNRSIGIGGASADSMQETGRVEQGSDSNQKFSNYTGKFNAFISNIVKIKILPFSQKPIEIKDLAEYCTNCGTKNKKNNYKFCPKCGTQF